MRWFVCCCLMVVLPLFALSGVVSAILGPVHYHASAAGAAADGGPMAGWQDFRRTDHVVDSTVHVHDHSKLGRHHHDQSDAGIVVVGAGEHDEGSDGAAAGATPAVVLAAAAHELAIQIPSRPTDQVNWLVPAACMFQSCDPRRLERPPIA